MSRFQQIKLLRDKANRLAEGIVAPSEEVRFSGSSTQQVDGLIDWLNDAPPEERSSNE